MTRRSSISRTHLVGRGLRHAALAAALVMPVQFVTASIAEAQSGSSSHRVNARSTSNGAAQRLDLSIGKSLIIELPRDAKEVFVANPKVANAIVRSARKLFIIGVADGATSIFAMDGDGQQIATLDISVGRDLNVLRQTLRTALPRADIEVKPAGDSILLIGNVANASDASQAMDIAKAFVGISGGVSGASVGAVINSLSIRGRDQVMLKVTVAEVSRQALKQLGVDAAGSWVSRSFGAGASLTSPFTVNLDQPASAFNLGGVTAQGNPSNGAILRAMERAGVSRILAEPTLTAVSGEAAKFTAGGEIPVPISQTCTPAAFPGGAPVCQIGLEFKPFGVSLNFSPVVLSEGRISMRVATEVTEVDQENSRSVGGTLQVPGFRVRKADTTIEVPSGGTMMTAGLIQQSSRQAINGLPGLINLPILGSLFRSRDYLRNETELLIMVTPYLAKPADPRQVARPDDGFVDAHDAQTVLLGRLNKIYGAGSAGAAQGYRGRVGFIAD